MSNTKIYLLVFMYLVAFWGTVIYIVVNDPKYEKRVNCDLSEISPDFTTGMRKQCRELTRNKL